MGNQEQFFFGIPLIGRNAARGWQQVTALFAKTVRSILAQSCPDFRVIVAGQDRPAFWDDLARFDERLEFLEAQWPSSPPTCANDDGGMKKHLILERVLESGGGLLMYCDADDLVDRRTVELARAMIDSENVAGLVSEGVAIDARSDKALPLPDEVAFDGEFHELCGSTTIARVRPGQPVPHDVLGSHHQWKEQAERLDVPLVHLPLFGGYHVNTGDNHSETEGQFAHWRRHFSDLVTQRGRPLSRSERRRLGLPEAR